MGFSEKQRQILRFPYTQYQALICDGAVRSGKTSVMSLSFVLWVMGNFRGCSFAICGKSVGSVERNIVTPLLSVGYLRGHFDIRYLRGDHMLLIRRGERENRIYLFGGKDESSYALIQGVTLAGILLDEVALMPRSVVEQALARCSVAGARFWFNCNPDSPRHWFYQEWILGAQRHNALHLHFLMEDNPGLGAETLELYRTTYSGVFYQRYVLGEWVVAEGLVYTMFHSGLVVDEIPWQAKQRGRWFISVDYGTVNPTSAGLWCLWNGTAYRVSEYYYDRRKPGHIQRTDEEHYLEIEKLAGSRQIERIVLDPSAASFKATIRRHGRFSVWDAVNSVLDGIRLTATLLKAGRLKFHRSCEGCLGEFQAYRWDTDAREDAVIKENDHAMDDIRYFCATVMARGMRGV